MGYLMANTDHLLISKVLTTGQINEVLQSGIRPDHFTGESQTMWIWILNYWRNYGSVPTERAFHQEFGDFTIYDSTMEPFPALVDELYHSYKRQKLIETISVAMPEIGRAHV